MDFKFPLLEVCRFGFLTPSCPQTHMLNRHKDSRPFKYPPGWWGGGWRCCWGGGPCKRVQRGHQKEGLEGGWFECFSGAGVGGWWGWNISWGGGGVGVFLDCNCACARRRVSSILPWARRLTFGCSINKLVKGEMCCSSGLARCKCCVSCSQLHNRQQLTPKSQQRQALPSLHYLSTSPPMHTSSPSSSPLIPHLLCSWWRARMHPHTHTHKGV